MDRDHFWLSDRQSFTRREPHLLTVTNGKPRVDDRRVVSGIIHVLLSGCRWKTHHRGLEAAKDALQSFPAKTLRPLVGMEKA